MSKKNKKTEAPEEEIVNDTVETAETEETAAEAAEENIEVSQEPENIQPTEEVKADEVNGAAEEAAAGDAKVGTITRPVNFRTGPSFKNAVIAELKSGSKVTLNGTVEGDKGTWYKCEFDGREGYVKASGLSV